MNTAPPGFRAVLASLRQPKVAVMMLLGFASGLPFMLVGNTMGYWLRDEGIELAAIGFLSWVGLAYSLKFLWAPLVDRLDAPWLGRWLGRRRGWMLLAQLTVMAALSAMAWLRPEGGLVAFGALALLAAFASATQDIVVDAWRIESADTPDALPLLSAAYQFGYRGALLLTDALILIAVASLGWALSYQAMAACMALGLVGVWWAREPVRGDLAPTTADSAWHQRLAVAVVGPFTAFFRRHGRMAMLVLLTISLYRLPDFFMGPMANPLYADLALDKEMVGSVRGSIGLVATLAGTAAAGLAALRIGLLRTLLAGAVIGPASNVMFAWLAWSQGDQQVFALAMAVDNFSAGFAGIALIAYMSSLTQAGYTATQYALLSSFYALLGKALKGLSGLAVESLEAGRTLMDAYALFFLGTAAMGIPVVLLCAWLLLRQKTHPVAC